MGDSFSTGSSSFTLASVGLKLIDPGGVTVDLMSNGCCLFGDPFAQNTLETIGTIAGSATGSGFGGSDYFLNLPAPYTLAPNTRYWILVQTTNGGSLWDASTDLTAQGVAGEFWSDYFTDGGVSNAVSGAPFQMEISDTAVPEPATFVLLGLALLAALWVGRARIFCHSAP